jgi:hypothetical protein
LTTPSRHAWRLAFGVAVLASLVVLYAPRAAGDGVPHLDKLVHLLLFATLAVTGLRAGARPLVLLLLLLAHAVSSELIQEHLLTERGGDPLDLLADLAGVAGGSAFERASWRRERAAP